MSYIFGSEIFNGIYISECDFFLPKFYIFGSEILRLDTIFLGLRELTDKMFLDVI